MKKSTRLILNCILAAALLVGSVNFLLSRRENYLGQQDYDQAIQVAYGQAAEQTTPTEQHTAVPYTSAPTQAAEAPAQEVLDDPLIQELLAIDLEALREENEDIIGWIRIPDTKVDYPLLQWTDNEFYLEHTWKQAKNASGAIFMECQNQPDFSEFNTIIYGHNMNNGSMFGSLHHYRRPNYWESHPYVYIVNDAGVLRFDVFAAQSASTKSIIYGLGIETDQRKTEFLRFAQDYSFFETDMNPTVEDRILTLSTCTGAGHTNRWVVLCVLNEAQSVKRPS